MPDATRNPLATLAGHAPLLRVAVVGHTNTGKTSLLRTLTRDPGFGDVADEPGTTRHVQGVRLSADGEPVLDLYDTPGMEDGIALLDYLDRLDTPGLRQDGPARIERFLDSPEARGRFEQEARVLRQMLASDAALYVIDARDPVLGKHRDELAVLAMCGRPLLPVLNFVHGEHRAADWRAALSRLGLHALVEFDTVAPALDGEAQLYGRLAMMADAHAPALQRLADDIQRQRADRHQTGLRLVAELLTDAAALRLESAPDDASLEQAGQQLRDLLRKREQACVDALLALYNFRAEDYLAAPLPLAGTRWDMDLFHPQALRDMGIHVGKGMAAGAAAGAAVDVISAGLSLGTGMLIGAAAGGLWQGAERLGKRVLGRLRGHQELTADDAILRLLALRQTRLLAALERRGHATRTPIALAQPLDDAWRKGALPPQLEAARSHPEWSALTPDYASSARRDAAVAELAASLSAGWVDGQADAAGSSAA